ncbi:MAG TPA: GGDEF domain-containing protein, partial [Candidatus Nitrosotenuis sp.]|nr:GGDEF domain-containing protein [Candidatus Nitrosotenuis sp.]
MDRERGGDVAQVYDKLTGLYEKKYFLEHLDVEVARCGRYRRPLSVLMLEIDYTYFPSPADVRWSMGYLIFKQLGAILLATLRRMDMAARYEGDNVAAFLPETGEEGAILCAERLRTRVENHEFMGATPEQRLRLAVNVGVAVFPRHGKTAEELIEAARAGMLAAREQGGNRV